MKCLVEGGTEFCMQVPGTVGLKSPCRILEDCHNDLVPQPARPESARSTSVCLDQLARPKPILMNPAVLALANEFEAWVKEVKADTGGFHTGPSGCSHGPLTSTSDQPELPENDADSALKWMFCLPVNRNGQEASCIDALAMQERGNMRSEASQVSQGAR